MAEAPEMFLLTQILLVMCLFWKYLLNFIAVSVKRFRREPYCPATA